MPVIEVVDFETAYGAIQRVELLNSDVGRSNRFETTLITGQNGSHKSTLLKQLVNALVLPQIPDLFSPNGSVRLNPNNQQVLCLSGSAADRFPPKELSQGRRSSFDVPFYTYVGQRVGNNLLSRKAPLETMLAFALSPRSIERCRWPFFKDAHRHAGVLPHSKYTLIFRSSSRTDAKTSLESMIGHLNSIRPETDNEKYNRRPFPNVSYATAQWLLKEFSADEFSALRQIVKNQARFNVVLTERGPISDDADANVLRLGLITEVLRLQEVQVHSSRSDTDFSALELSSGEYHMFSTILAIGFGLDEQSVLLMDEPENSLHPQWQRDLMETVFGACSQVMKGGHVIVSTHSPLIVGSASQGSTVVDMTGSEPHQSTVPFGASSDELLLTQFGIGSSRNRVVVDKVQFAVSLIERGDFESEEFLALIPELMRIRAALTSGDPMIDVINALVGEVFNP